MSHEFLDLPYPHDALEPHIDAMTMEIHHGKHHRTYFDKMIGAIKGTDAESLSIEDLLKSISKCSAAVRNNAGGYYNHNLFWNCMSPDGGGDPSGSLANRIEGDIGGADALRTEMTNAGIGRFGSGFAWLVVSDGSLRIMSTPNQDNPLMDVVEGGGIPILGIDVWEHAYYLKYQNRRPDYLEAFWNVVDWRKTGERFEAAMQ